eukprot:1157433-Pelagomonas_calceolata.AAC.2
MLRKDASIKEHAQRAVQVPQDPVLACVVFSFLSHAPGSPGQAPGSPAGSRAPRCSHSAPARRQGPGFRQHKWREASWSFHNKAGAFTMRLVHRGALYKLFRGHVPAGQGNALKHLGASQIEACAHLSPTSALRELRNCTYPCTAAAAHTHTHTHSQQLAGGLLLVQLPKYTHCLGLGLLGVEVSCRHAAAVGSPPAKSHHLQRGVQDGAQIDRQRL